MAVIAELVDVMTIQLQNSKKVKLNGFGSFKIGFNSTAADTAKEFNSGINIKNAHVLFQPITTIAKNGLRVKTFINGIKIAELPQNLVVKTTPAPAPEPTPGV